MSLQACDSRRNSSAAHPTAAAVFKHVVGWPPVAYVCVCVTAVGLQVKTAATEAGVATFKLVGNRDIEHILDDLLHCVARPAEVPDVVTKLSATTFVQVRHRGGRGGRRKPVAAAAQTLDWQLGRRQGNRWSGTG